jgi:hypothetical protein
VPEPAGGPAPPGPEHPEIAADLARAEGERARGERLAELPAGPGAVLVEQAPQRLGHLPAAVVIGRRPRPARVQGGGTAAEEVLEDAADGVAAVAEVAGDLRRRPAGIGEGDHLQAVVGSGR